MQTPRAWLHLFIAAQVAVPATCLLPAGQLPAWHYAEKQLGSHQPPHRLGVQNLAAESVKATKVSAASKELISSTDLRLEKLEALPEFKQFLPTCVRHLKELVYDVDGSYTDVQLKTVLQHECLYEKHFPLSKDDGFPRKKHCEDFASLLTSAREAELFDGSTFPYKRACESYWELKGGKLPWSSFDPNAEAKKPMMTKDTMPPVSTTLWCIINLTLQYFGLYTASVIIRTLISFKFGNLVGIQQILEVGCTTVTYAPMLCVLFLGARMRAIQLSQGHTEKYNLPQPWVQTSMVVATSAVIAQVVLVLLVGFMSGVGNVTTDKEGNLDVSAMNEYPPLALKLLTIVRYAVMAMLYGGFTAVVFGVFLMEGPKEIWGKEDVPVSPAVMCTILLSGLFFLVYLLVAISKTCFELSKSLRSSPALLKLEASAAQAKMTVNFAPMLCVLFIGARMRALQIDPRNGNPQSWAQKAFFICTFSILLQAILVIIMPFMARGQCKRGAFEGDIAFAMENPTVGAVMTALRYVCLLALYGGIAVVVYSVFVIKHPEGFDQTPPVSPAMQCVINLTVQYFFIYIMLFVCITVKSFGAGNGLEANDAERGFASEAPFTSMLNKSIAIFDAARGTVMFAPMLAILFIGARMRALQLSRNKDGTISPQAGPPGMGTRWHVLGDMGCLCAARHGCSSAYPHWS